MPRQMKDSGVEWIGEIPEKWQVARLKDIKSADDYAIVDGPFGTAISTSDYREEGVPLSRIVNLLGKELRTDNFVYITQEHANLLNRSKFYKGDIIFAKTGATVGKCAINTNVEEGVLSSSCVKIRVSEDYCRDYFYYFFNTSQFNEALRNSCNGTTRDTINLKPFACLNCIIPSYEEQVRIAEYLDDKCAYIDSVIEKTKESIEEYKKLKQAIITEAVTKGICGEVLEKDSGDVLIGAIPSDRSVTKVKFVTNRVTDGAHISPEYDENGYDYISTVNIKNGIIDFNGCIKTSKESYEMFVNTGCQPHKNDVLISKDGSVGKTIIVREEREFVVGSSLVIMTPMLNLITPEYLNYNLQSEFVQTKLLMIMHGTALKRVSVEKNANLPIVLVSIDKQNEIVNYLDEKCFEIDSIINQKQKFLCDIELLKKSLIYEYVTGKKEVLAL